MVDFLLAMLLVSGLGILVSAFSMRGRLGFAVARLLKGDLTEDEEPVFEF